MKICGLRMRVSTPEVVQDAAPSTALDANWTGGLDARSDENQDANPHLQFASGIRMRSRDAEGQKPPDLMILE